MSQKEADLIEYQRHARISTGAVRLRFPCFIGIYFGGLQTAIADRPIDLFSPHEA